MSRNRDINKPVFQDYSHCWICFAVCLAVGRTGTPTTAPVTQLLAGPALPVQKAGCWHGGSIEPRGAACAGRSRRGACCCTALIKLMAPASAPMPQLSQRCSTAGVGGRTSPWAWSALLKSGASLTLCSFHELEAMPRHFPCV